jgi:murein DD-endopeptidase MepM/ murein hydrolase activator NlpD
MSSAPTATETPEQAPGAGRTSPLRTRSPGARGPACRTTRLAAGAAGLAVAAALLAGVPPATAGPAERQRDVQRAAQDLRHELEGTSAELAAAFERLRQAEDRLPSARAELDGATAAVAEATRREAELREALAQARAQEEAAVRHLAETAARIGDTRVEVGRIAAESYRQGGMPSGLDLALGAGDPGELASRMAVLASAAAARDAALERLRANEVVGEVHRARLEETRRQVADLAEQAQATLVEAREAQARAVRAQAEVEALVATAAAATQEIERRRAAEEQRLAALEAEAEQLRREIERRAREAAAAAAREAARRAERALPPPPPAAGSGLLLRPVDGRVSSNYGWRIHPIYKTRRMHTGTDFANGCGTPVRAGAAGVVVRARSAGGYGNQVVLDHGILGGDAVSTSYSHLSRYAVSGGPVARGEVIGYVGTTGASTGCHLHFEVFVDGRRVDPRSRL